jgi:uridine phosphorylase
MAKMKRGWFSRVAIGSAAMPRRLRPTAATAADAILVGDPGRALLLAQELLEEPKMSNHARGLWGYFGITPQGKELTIQSTGMGGPSAALVLGDLAELGVKRGVRVGTCVGNEAGGPLGNLLVVREAIAAGGSATSFGIETGAVVTPDPELTERLVAELGADGHLAAIASVDAHPAELSVSAGIAGIDMQTAPLLARAPALQIRLAAALIVSQREHGSAALEQEELAEIERRVGRASAAILSA